jgi:RNA polymerase sigma-70 factor (ECF subfamily)
VEQTQKDISSDMPERREYTGGEIYQAIGQLPEQKRLVCLYKLRENLSNQEIAERMGISLPTVKSHYTQAIKMLRAALTHLFVLILGL